MRQELSISFQIRFMDLSLISSADCSSVCMMSECFSLDSVMTEKKHGEFEINCVILVKGG